MIAVFPSIYLNLQRYISRDFSTILNNIHFLDLAISFT